jgi:hypothetical protein
MGLSQKMQELSFIAARRVAMRIGLILVLSFSVCQSRFVMSSFLVARQRTATATTHWTTTTTTSTTTIREGRSQVLSLQRHARPLRPLAAETTGATTTTTTTSGDATTNSIVQKKKNLWSVEECLLAYHNNNIHNNNQKNDSGVETRIHFVDSSWYHKGSRNGRDEYVTKIMEWKSFVLGWRFVVLVERLSFTLWPGSFRFFAGMRPLFPFRSTIPSVVFQC